MKDSPRTALMAFGMAAVCVVAGLLIYALFAGA